MDDLHALIPTNLGSRQQPGQQMQRNCYAFNYDGIVTNQTANELFF